MSTSMSGVCIAALFFFAAASSSNAQSQIESPVVLEKAPILVLDLGGTSADGVFFLRRAKPGAATGSITLTAGAVRNYSTGEARPLNAGVAFAAGEAAKASAGETVFKMNLDSGWTDPQPVRIFVTNLWDSGQTEIDLHVNSVKIGSVKALKHRVPLNVKPVAADPDKPELVFVRGQKLQLTLRNDDALTYPVALRVYLKGTVEPFSLTLPPNSSESVVVDPNPQWFSWWSWIKEERAEGALAIRYAPAVQGKDGADGALITERAPATKTIPFKARLNGVGSFGQSLLAYLLMLAVMGLG